MREAIKEVAATKKGKGQAVALNHKVAFIKAEIEEWLLHEVEVGEILLKNMVRDEVQISLVTEALKLPSYATNVIKRAIKPSNAQIGDPTKPKLCS